MRHQDIWTPRQDQLGLSAGDSIIISLPTAPLYEPFLDVHPTSEFVMYLSGSATAEGVSAVDTRITWAKETGERPGDGILIVGYSQEDDEIHRKNLMSKTSDPDCPIKFRPLTSERGEDIMKYAERSKELHARLITMAQRVIQLQKLPPDEGASRCYPHLKSGGSRETGQEFFDTAVDATIKGLNKRDEDYDVVCDALRYLVKQCYIKEGT